MLRILYFHQHFSTPEGAAGIRSYEMAQALARAGHQVVMACGSYGQGATGLTGPFVDGARRGVVDGIEVVEFDMRYSNRDGFLRRSLTFLRFALRSVALAYREPHDVLFATTTPLTAGLPGILTRFVRRRPFVFEVRDLWPELPRAMGVIRNPVVLAGLSALEWASYRTADHCIALAPGIADGIAARGVDPSRITMIPNGCDIERLAAGDDAWRPEGVGANDLMAVFAGTHGLANGLDAVLDAAEELRRRGRDDIRLVLVGEGARKQALIDRAAGSGLTNVIFHAPIPKARLAGLLKGADLGLQILADIPAFGRGTSPNKFFDYLALGLPVLNNYPGWLAEMIDETACGFVVPAGDANAFADALEQAADDRTELKAKGRRAFGLAGSRFDRRHLAQRFVAVIEAAGGRSGRRDVPADATPVPAGGSGEPSAL